MEDVAEIAKGLSKAQRRVVLGLDGAAFVDYKVAGIRKRETRMALTNGGITEPHREGPVTMWSSIRLTPLGLAVRAHLEKQS